MMKLLSSFIGVSLLFMANPLCAALTGVSLDVQLKHAAKPAATTKGKGPAKNEQNEKLAIKVQNDTQNDLGTATVQYWFFARDLKTKELKVLKSGALNAALAPKKDVTVETPEVSASYQYAQPAAGKGKKGKPAKAKPVTPNGEKIIGFAVQVKDASPAHALLAEYYSAAGMKEAIDKAKPEPAKPTKPAAKSPAKKKPTTPSV